MTAPTQLINRRVFRAPRDLVFACMTTPEHLTHFWGPVGTTTPLGDITVDLRVGGVFETVIVNDRDGSRHTMHVVYDEVDPPERLVWTDPASGMVTTITFTDLGNTTTEVVTQQTNVRDGSIHETGHATSVDRFDTYLATLTGTH